MNEILAALKTVVKGKACLHEPVFQGNEWKYVKECIDTGWVSSVGSYVEKFEKMLIDYTGAAGAVAVVNGTSALHIALILAGVEENDEVLMPALTFVATANAVNYCKAVPHFVDSSLETMGVCPDKLEAYLKEIGIIKNHGLYNKQTGRRIKSLIVMHTFGHPVDLDKIINVCEKYNIKLIEDAAESLGSYYKGKQTGTFGELGILSFNGNKTVTTGGGGAILTNDVKLARLAKHITTTAKVPHKWLFNHDMRGYNYRMPNINAALGCAQLEELSEFIERKRRLFLKYKDAFLNIKDVYLFEEPKFARSNYWLQVLILRNKKQRDMLLEMTNAEQIATRPCWTLISELSIYDNLPKMDLENAKLLSDTIINIPSSASL